VDATDHHDELLPCGCVPDRKLGITTREHLDRLLPAD
jgi:hypothetical protein